MRFLLIAYEFPPSPSPQSLRWAYLCRELIARNHDVHVLTIHLGGETPGLPALPQRLQIHRTFAGPIRGALAKLRDRRQRSLSADPRDLTTPTPSQLRPPRSWKQSLSERVQAFAATMLFPDVRGEWLPWAKPALRRLLADIRPDIVVSSHEPATTLELGLLASRSGIPWIADLGDPVLASYTPVRWRRRARTLEKSVCLHANHITVTTPRAAQLIAARHGRSANITVLTQGFRQNNPMACSSQDPLFDPERLELLYTGTFYSFRKADELVAALSQHPAARLSIASITAPPALVAAAERMPEQIRLLGFLPHERALMLQSQADVLINIANEDPSQIPGKLYEYFGSQRPILHLGAEGDAISALVTQLRRGWNAGNSAKHIGQWLSMAMELKKVGRLDENLDLSPGPVSDYSWSRIAARLETVAAEVLSSTRI